MTNLAALHVLFLGVRNVHTTQLLPKLGSKAVHDNNTERVDSWLQSVVLIPQHHRPPDFGSGMRLNYQNPLKQVQV